jgi:PAS domain S-box-containing protein
MKIRTRLRVNSYISLGVLFIALLSLLWSYLEVLQADKKTGLVEKMRNVHFERTILRDEYLLHQEVRARIQWIAKSGDFEKLIDLADTLLTSREEKAMMEEAREEFVQTVLVFSKIIGSREKNERRGGAELLSAEAEKRLLSHVFQNASALTDTIKRIREAEQKNAIRARDRENAFIVLFFIGVVVIIVANSNAVYRIFTKRITALSDGARILGSGNLDHRIEAEGDDELSALARSNNEMAVRLKESYTSIDNLQKEMAERALAEKALRESEDRFRLLIEGVSDYAIFMLDPDGNVVSWNSGAERIKGYREDEIIGKNFNRFYTQEDSAHGKPQQDLQDAITAGRFEDEGWRLRKDGSRFWANVIITALRDRGGQLRGFSKVTRDITERKQAEEKTE